MPDGLIEAADSILIVVDAQEAFLRKLPAAESGALITRIGWLIGVAVRLNIPLVVTAEEIPRHGGVAPALAGRLPAGTLVFDKMIFGLAAVPDIRAAVDGSGRNTAILTGLETDVCVAQSAIGLQAAGYRVAVVADAAGSGGTGHALGLERLRSAGVSLISVKGLYYEWLRTVTAEEQFRQKYGAELGDPGVPL